MGGREKFAVVKAELSERLLPLMKLEPGKLVTQPGVQFTSEREGPFHLPVPGASSRVYVRPCARAGLSGVPPAHALRLLGAGAHGFSAGLPIPEILGLTCRKAGLLRWDAEFWTWWLSDSMSVSLCLKRISFAGDSKKELLATVARALRAGHDGGLEFRGMDSRSVIVMRTGGGWKALLTGLDRAALGPSLGWPERTSQLRGFCVSLAKDSVIPKLLSEPEMAAMVRAYLGPDQMMFERLHASCSRSLY